MRTLVLAAGGGGDAVGALLLRRLVPDVGERPVIGTLAWERLRVDPLPGPRGRSGFTGLLPRGGDAYEVDHDSDTIPPGCSMLPRLAAETGARLFLLDPAQGGRGLTEQMVDIARAVEADQLLVVDIGGDIVAEGHEPRLRSPMADAMILGAAEATGIPGSVAVAGPGLDGELTAHEVRTRLHRAAATLLGTLTADDARPLSGVLEWHPTEASALLAAAANGLRGGVDMRRGDEAVALEEGSAEVWQVDIGGLTSITPLPSALAKTETLDQANDVIRELAVSELDYERAKSAGRAHHRPLGPMPRDLYRYALDAQQNGREYVTTRRFLEALDVHVTEPGLLDRLEVNGIRVGPLWSIGALVRYTEWLRAGRPW